MSLNYNCGLSYRHNLIAVKTKIQISRRKHKEIVYRSYKHFEEEKFIYDIECIPLLEDFKRKRNFFVNLSQTLVSNYFKDSAQSKTFWQGENENEIMLYKDDVIITEPGKVGEVFNDYFIKVTEDIGIRENIDGLTISDILDMYKDHHSVLKIANNHDGQLFTLKPVSVQEMEKIISHVNPHKATGFDQFPPKLLRTAGFAIAPSLTLLVNHTIACSQFPADLKCAELSSMFKKDDILDKTKYSPLSILLCISKIMEGVIANQARIYFSAILDVCISAFRKDYNTKSILLKANGLR